MPIAIRTSCFGVKQLDPCVDVRRKTSSEVLTLKFNPTQCTSTSASPSWVAQMIFQASGMNQGVSDDRFG